MTITWTENNAPLSTVFQDIYYNPDCGLEESEYVFINGNSLTARWQNSENFPFTITELGFGTGLNFMLTWLRFDEICRQHNEKLHFISVEKFPLCKDDISRALLPWKNLWQDRLDIFLASYPEKPQEMWQATFENITLTVYFEDAITALRTIKIQSNAWYLDGFAPSKNLDMWSNDIFIEMARLSKPQATFSTFTSAGFVKRGLQSAGFDVKKHKGFGSKWDSLIGTFNKQQKK